MKPDKNISAIILSAGKSTRMGVPKFSLRFDHESTFLEKIAGIYADWGCNEIIIVMSMDGIEHLKKLSLSLPSNSRIALNDHPEWARFYSLKTGVRNLKNISRTFVSNIDNPFLNPEILDILSDNMHEYDYLYPTFNGCGGHPFMISGTVTEKIFYAEDDQIHMRDFLTGFNNSGIVVHDEKILLNINTSEEYRRYFNGENR